MPILTVKVDGDELRLVPPRTNNYLEGLFRRPKGFLRRCTGRAKIPREFASVGHLLPYYLTMRDHKFFREIFANDNRLAEEFAKLFKHQWQPPENLTVLPIPLEAREATQPDAAGIH